MLSETRYAYNETSLLAVQYIMLAQMILVGVAVVLHAVSSLAGFSGVFETPALLAISQPVMKIMLLPGIGWAAGLIATWMAGDDGFSDSGYQLAGNVAGQLACLILLPSAIGV
ncbi:hypothetical protein ACM61V_00230 [Sphingomonas sp. TX0543]|jgi:hypothetical protein|uniref:hypothetical protein n=1 Tax=Sphingomonadales TaxID=204457 RepID=UPI0028C0D3E1|nr:hypothetical protein [Sphingobium sp. SA2]MDT7533182.1 hypothetical protein [Sphingobium sp. SA2]|tara:strand:- start:2449 stop:2787 length:339 start_codon:yes stop_codon:yes gene_type:complete